MTIDRRSIIKTSVSAPFVLSFSQNSWANSPNPLYIFNPFLPPKRHYNQIRADLWKQDRIKVLVNKLLEASSQTKEFDTKLTRQKDPNQKYADWAIVYWYNYWRLVPLGQPRIHAAEVGQRMIAYMIKKRGRTAWTVFWEGAFLGLEGISRGVLNSAQLLAKFEALMQESADLDPDLYYANARLGLAKLYIKAPPFPASIGNMNKGLKILRELEPIQKGKFALWYLFAAEAELIRGNYEASLDLLDRLDREVKPLDVASQIVFVMAQIDANGLRLAIQDDTYDRYKWDPMFTPLDRKFQNLIQPSQPIDTISPVSAPSSVSHETLAQ